jgi:hypothetical protein
MTRRLTRTLVTRFWDPVGVGVQPDEEVRLLATYLFDGTEGRAAAHRRPHHPPPARLRRHSIVGSVDRPPLLTGPGRQPEARNRGKVGRGGLIGKGSEGSSEPIPA